MTVLTQTCAEAQTKQSPLPSSLFSHPSAKLCLALSPRMGNIREIRDQSERDEGIVLADNDFTIIKFILLNYLVSSNSGWTSFCFQQRFAYARNDIFDADLRRSTD